MGVNALSMKPYFIVNPVAGGGKAAERFEKVKSFLEAKGIEIGCCMTERANQSTELAREAYERGERFIVAVGGDGTINEVASAIYDKSDVTMGICPFGTGNDFVRVLGLSDDPEEAALTIISGSPSPVDIGMAGGRPFTNVGGFGFDVDVVINTEKYKRRFHGMIPYLLGIVKSLLHLKSVHVKITADGDVFEDDVVLCAVGNGSHFGGGMAALPKASANDGLFDICIVKKISLPHLLVLLPSFIKGKHLNKKPVRYLHAKEVVIECDRTPMQLDGELGEYAPTTFRIIPGALRIMLPARA